MSYEILVGLNVIDDEKYQQYRNAMKPILSTYGGNFGYDFRVSEVLISENEDDINRVFTINFPNSKKKEAFFNWFLTFITWILLNKGGGIKIQEFGSLALAAIILVAYLITANL